MSGFRGIGGCIIILLILLGNFTTSVFGQGIPEEAQRYMARGMAAVEMAKTPKDYERAVLEFEQAAKIAPDYADVYYNLGSVLTQAGNYREAIRNYRRYLELAPKASDIAKVRDEIYKLEYRLEQEEARPKEMKKDGRFILYYNMTTLDTKTGLMWAAVDNTYSSNWGGAKSYCERYRQGDYTDWRMPTLEELAGLYDASKSSPALCSSKYSICVATQLITLSCVWYWASEVWPGGSDAASFGFLPSKSGGRLLGDYVHGEGNVMWRPKSDQVPLALPVRCAK